MRSSDHSSLLNPFVGLRPFEFNDRELYFGRARETETCYNLVSTLPVVVIYARSGTGKSSLLNAGLMPRLLEDDTTVVVAIPKDVENITLFVEEQLRTGSLPASDRPRLSDIMTTYSDHTGKRVVLILDQFEERLNAGLQHDALYESIAWLCNSTRVTPGVSFSAFAKTTWVVSNPSFDECPVC